jgi:hypothetical protein
MLTTEALRVKILVFNSMLLCYICPFDQPAIGADVLLAS